MQHAPVYLIRLSDIAPLLNLTAPENWEEALSVDNILAFARSNHVDARSWDVVRIEYAEPNCESSLPVGHIHERRIAWFVRNGIPRGDKFPITVKVDEGGAGLVWGWHRMIAASLRRDTHVEIAVEGDVKQLHALMNAAHAPKKTARPVMRCPLRRWVAFAF